jgi:AcrR family transcriptional regulator
VTRHRPGLSGRPSRRPWKQIGFLAGAYTDLFPGTSVGSTLSGVPHVTKPSPRQRLIDAAADLFYRQGIGAVGVDLISRAAGVSKRTLYQEFGSKDQLIAQSLDAKGDEILGLYIGPGDASPGEASARQEILGVFSRLGGWAASDMFRGCPFINTCTELASPAHPARLVAGAYKQRLRGYFARQAQRAGAADPQRLAAQLIAFFDGAIVQAVAGTPLDPGTLDAAIRALLDAQGAIR